MLTVERIARIRVCGDNVELYQQKSPPRFDGPGFIVWRDKKHQIATVLMNGLTRGGIEVAAKAFRENGMNPTNLVLEQDRLKQVGHSQVKLTRLGRSEKFVLKMMH
ncbi:hypothetical protein JW977_02845 [Candidatus Falkowbacteria bacterium]|nr:hypothetical protein [Candidatus Falkowbacteria bacterium]